MKLQALQEKNIYLHFSVKLSTPLISLWKFIGLYTMNSCILYCVNASRTKSREKIHHDDNVKFRTHITFQANFYIKLHESYLVPEEHLDYKILEYIYIFTREGNHFLSFL